MSRVSWPTSGQDTLVAESRSRQVYRPTGPGRNDRGLSRKHIMESIEGSLRRLRSDYVDLYQVHRYDVATPLEAFADIVHFGKAHYIGVSEWPAEQIRRAHALPRELRTPLVSNQPQYNALWRVIEGEVVPACEELGMGQVVFSPIVQGVLTASTSPVSSLRRAPVPPMTRSGPT